MGAQRWGDQSGGSDGGGVRRKKSGVGEGDGGTGGGVVGGIAGVLGTARAGEGGAGL